MVGVVHNRTPAGDGNANVISPAGVQSVQVRTTPLVPVLPGLLFTPPEVVSAVALFVDAQPTTMARSDQPTEFHRHALKTSVEVVALQRLTICLA